MKKTETAPSTSDVRQYPIGFSRLAIPGAPRLTERDVKKLTKKFVKAIRNGRPVPQPPAAASYDVTARPQVIYRGERLVVATSCARHFVISDIVIGNRSQLPSFGSLSAEAFSENAIGTRINLETAHIAQDITLKVQNFSRKSRDFRAVMFGAAIH